MFSSWSRMPRGQRRTWAMVAGAITTGTIIKVAYFKFSRSLMLEDSSRKHKEGLEHLREARKFAEWSQQDREARLPKLTTEQKEQMNNYIQLIDQHGMSKSFAASAGGEESCEGCPVMASMKKMKQSFNRSTSAEE